MSAADPAALVDMANERRRRDERAAAGAAASSSASAPPPRYARRRSLARADVPLDLLLHAPSSPCPAHAREASPASIARARRDLWAAPGREHALMFQAALFPLAVWAYGFAVSSDGMARWQADRYWPTVPRVRIPQLRSTNFGVLAGMKPIFFREADEFLRSSSRWLGRLPPWMRPPPPGAAPGAPRPPVPPVKDW